MNITAQTQKLLTKLRASAYILILDNLESITGQQLAIQNTLPEADQKQLQDFLTRLVGGQIRVILGSRSLESWLQGAFKQNIYNLQGLDNVSLLKLTGKNVIGAIKFPDASVELESFLAANLKTFKKSQKEIIKKLAIEAEHNQKLKIEITSNIT